MHERSYRYFDLVLVAFVTVLVCSNLIGPAKMCEIRLGWSIPGLGNSFLFGAGNIFFPISYIFGDVLTEVYGYARARRVIWAGFGALIFTTMMTLVMINLPPWQGQPESGFNEKYNAALAIALGATWRISSASMIAYWIGDFMNSYVLAKMKVASAGKHLWQRTIGSTIIGQGLDSIVFYPLAFYGIWPDKELLQTMAFNWVFKVSIEVLFTPLTYLVVNFLKRAELEDFYDRNTDFNPFTMDVSEPDQPAQPLR